MVEESNEKYADVEILSRVYICVSCGYRYKQEDKYCMECGDDAAHLHVNMNVRPVKSIEFIDFSLIKVEENDTCTLVSKE